MMTNSKLNYWKKYCCEPLELVESYAAAKADNFAGWCIHHKLEIQQDKRVSRQELKDKDLYYGRPASELIFMRFGDHSALHSTGNTNMKGKHHSAETRQKIAEANKSRTLSEEYRKKLSESLSGENNPFFGKHHSEETRRKISESCKGKPGWLKGKHLSEETRKKLSESLKGKNNPLFGKHHTEDTRKKIAEAKKGKHLSAETRKKMSEAICGMLYWNNGISNKRSRECPGEGWTRGRLSSKV